MQIYICIETTEEIESKQKFVPLAKYYFDILCIFVLLNLLQVRKNLRSNNDFLFSKLILKHL